MKKRLQIQVKALLLLLIYVFSNSPSILFHHHESEVAAYDEATPCEKSIYYSDREGGCKHETHLFNGHEKCGLCDNHTVSPHSLQQFVACFFGIALQPDHAETAEHSSFADIPVFSNRGPPAVSSFAV